MRAFPDEEMRVRLWAAHVPPEAPTLGDFDFAELAHRFPLSGGYIRNSAVRAARCVPCGAGAAPAQPELPDPRNPARVPRARHALDDGAHGLSQRVPTCPAAQAQALRAPGGSERFSRASSGSRGQVAFTRDPQALILVLREQIPSLAEERGGWVGRHATMAALTSA